MMRQAAAHDGDERLAEAIAQQAIDEEPGERQDDDQREQHCGYPFRSMYASASSVRRC